jgi:hypothetical protein
MDHENIYSYKCVYLKKNNKKIGWTFEYTTIYLNIDTLLRWIILIDSQIMFNIKKLINTICKPIRTLHFNKYYYISK